MQPTMYRICVWRRISEQRVAMTVGNLAGLTAAECHHHKLEKPDESSPTSTIAC